MSEAEQWTVNCEMWNASFDSFSLLFSNQLEGFFWKEIELLTMYQHIRRKLMGKKEERTLWPVNDVTEGSTQEASMGAC